MRSPRPSPAVLLGIGLVVALALANSGAIRRRAGDGLARGMPSREAELARGFVLGEDEGVDEATKENFRRSGLSHLLAVSGENVTLLALLAMPVLGLFGIPLRERGLWMLGLIAVYVPVAGAGPSIQRAGVMGAVGVLATLGGRRASRLYALALAAVVTLAVDPSVAADIGWQLSFAAVLGILLLASPLRQRAIARLGEGPWRRALAEGLAVTIAATVATAPLIAFHFETLSTTTLLANVLAMPAAGLRVEVIDVGQGDAILLQPAAAPAVLVDGGPPGDELARKLADAGVDELGAAVITHDQSDHAAGVEELLGRFPIERLVYGRLDRKVLAEAAASGVQPERVAAGRELRSGALRLQ